MADDDDDRRSGEQEVRRQLLELQVRLASLDVSAAQRREEAAKLKAELDALPASIAVHNEQIKYTATFMNTVAAGAIVAGAIAPMTTLVVTGTVTKLALSLSVIWLLVGGALHWFVRKLLRRIKA